MIEIVEVARLGKKPPVGKKPTTAQLAAEIHDLVRVLLTCGDEKLYPALAGVVAHATEIASAATADRRASRA